MITKNKYHVSNEVQSKQIPLKRRRCKTSSIPTESPAPAQERSSGRASPRKRSPCRTPEMCKSVSELIKTVDYMAANCGSILDEIPEKEWRLLATLARKRDLEIEREKMSQQLRTIWNKEQEVRSVISAECADQYRRYLEKKREQEQLLQQYKTTARAHEDRMRQEDLLNYIRDKDQRSSHYMTMTQGRKAQEMIEKAMEQETRTLLATDRKFRHELADEWSRHLKLQHHQMRADMARQKKEALLKDASQRIAINNAIDHWESTFIKHEVEIMKEYKRAQHLANVELKKLRSEKIAQEREWKRERARRVAALTAQLRQCLIRDSFLGLGQ